MWINALKKPTKALAVLHDGRNTGRIIDWFVVQGYGKCVRFDGTRLCIQGRQGRQEVPEGCYIVSEARGEFFVLSPEEFQRDYKIHQGGKLAT